MKMTLMIMLASTFFCFAGSPEEAATKAAEDWLVLTDSGQYAESYNQAAAYFKQVVTREQWETAMQTVRDPLGKVISREPLSAKFFKSLPGAPEGSYVVVEFKVSFEGKKDAKETVTPMLDPDGQWRVSGYYIK